MPNQNDRILSRISMSKKIDLINHKYGKLTVIAEVKRDRKRGFRWLCKCQCGGIVTALGKDLRRGHRRSCGCLRKERGRKCSTTIEHIKQEVQSNAKGYNCLSNKYDGDKSKLSIQCDKGHRYKVIWSMFKQGRRCPICFFDRIRLSIKYIKKYMSKFGYTCKSDDYVNAFSSLDLICPAGHEIKMRWNNFHTGHRCGICSGRHRWSIKDVKFLAEKDGYTCLSKTYKNGKTRLLFRCPNGHTFKAMWTHFKRGSRCPQCAIIKKSGSGHHAWKGGISCEPYCEVWLDEEFKESIRERDGHQCQNPECWGKKSKGKLTVHHIDYVKKNCQPSNLITLCKSCNSRASFNQEYWQQLYERIMRIKYKKAA